MKTNTLKIVAGTIIMAAFILPTASFAKGKDKNEHEDRGCFRALGHLIAPGWIKHNSAITVSEDCHFSFGNDKKSENNDNENNNNNEGTSTSTSTPNTTALVISNINIYPRQTGATIQWTTNKPANGTVFYSTAATVNTNDASSSQSSTRGDRRNRDHRINLANQIPGTTYYVIVRSNDAAGNSSVSSTTSFITKSSTSTADTTAPVISNITAVLGTSTLQVRWTTDESATSKVFYATTSPVNVQASTTAFVGNSSLTTNHDISLANLATSTLYHIASQSTDASGNIRTSGEFTLTTLGF